MPLRFADVREPKSYSVRTAPYAFRVDSRFDEKIVRPLLEKFVQAHGDLPEALFSKQLREAFDEAFHRVAEVGRHRRDGPWVDVGIYALDSDDRE